MGERGIDPFLSYEQVRACHALYMQGLSIRQVAERVFPRTRYASVKSCANALHAQWKLLGLPRRDQAAMTAACNRARGSGLTRREVRVRAGEILDRPLCAGVRVRYPRKGAPCQRHALAGSDYCVAHDPDRRDALLAGLEKARAAA